jgi:hypothetical protein
MHITSAPSSETILSHLKRVAAFHDSFGRDLQAAELYSAIRNLEKSGLPPPGSDDAKQLEETLLEIEDFLDENGYRFLTKELHDLRIALDE